MTNIAPRALLVALASVLLFVIDDVVHAHRDQIDADGVVYASGERDLELRAHAVGAAHEHGIVDAAGHTAHSGDPADVGEDLRDARLLRQRLDALEAAPGRTRASAAPDATTASSSASRCAA